MGEYLGCSKSQSHTVRSVGTVESGQLKGLSSSMAVLQSISGSRDLNGIFRGQLAVSCRTKTKL